MDGGKLMKARICWRITSTGQEGKEEWIPVAEAEVYLARRKSLESAPYSNSTNWIEYEATP